jgi:dimethylamine/trimethylamine dehydrogenase
LARNPRYDILFEPVQIGPVTAKNRFYQVPHCSGMGYQLPRSVAAMRGVKAEGGWAVVNTEYCSIHPTSDDTPFITAKIWDQNDVRAHAVMVEQVHRHDALAGIELFHGGSAAANHSSRLPSLGPRCAPAGSLGEPIQSQAMTKRDIRELRRWFRDAAARSKQAGFDIIYVYGCHGYLFHQFLSASNQRPDEYGGSLENRARLLREVIEDTVEAVGDTCAVAVRYSATLGTDEPRVTDDSRGMLEILADLPDLWDVALDDHSLEMGASRFVKEAAFESAVSWVKELVSKPVVSVGRFTSPDTMLRMVKEGVIDLIGCARPSIADPFIPNKIDQGREDEIRECIGCNICFSGDQVSNPIRCTQNPTMGEEWRRGWHPERIPPKGSDRSVLIVGGGPAGLEAAVALGRRGYEVALAEAGTQLGGRVLRESALPGLAEWSRVADWRIGQLAKLPNVEIFLDSEVDAAQILEFGADRVALATGAKWRPEGIGREHSSPIPGWDGANVLTPDDVMGGTTPAGPVLVYDEDHYYMGNVVAEKLRRAGLDVILATPESKVALWAARTAEQHWVHARMVELGIQLELNTAIDSLAKGRAVLACSYTGRTREIEVASVVMVTSREPTDRLYHELAERIDIQRIGDCRAPGLIATAVYAGHRYAREMDETPGEGVPFRREGVLASSDVN